MKNAIILAAALGLAACSPADTNTVVEEGQASNPQAVVEGFYEAIGAGDMETAASLLAEDVSWSEAEGSPYAAGNPYVGFDAMGSGVFGPINEAFADFAGTPGQFTTQGNRVLVEGRYTGTNRKTGEVLDSPFVHAFTVEDGQIATFQQYTDTYQWRRLTGTVED